MEVFSTVFCLLWSTGEDGGGPLLDGLRQPVDGRNDPLGSDLQLMESEISFIVNLL